MSYLCSTFTEWNNKNYILKLFLSTGWFFVVWLFIICIYILRVLLCFFFLIFQNWEEARVLVRVYVPSVGESQGTT